MRKLVMAPALAALVALPAAASPPGLAYDEVTKIVVGTDVPEPGTFAADFDAAVAAQKSIAQPAKHRGVFGGLMNTVDMAKNAMNLMKTGAASSNFFLAGWERTDDPGAQTATIVKPQMHQVISLNVAKKTYRITDPNAQMPQATPPPVERARNTTGEPPRPGSGKLSITVSTTSLGARVIDNIPVTGYKVVFNLTETQSTGSCSDGTFQTTMVEYISRYALPRTAVANMPSASAPAVHPEMMALKAGCTPAISIHASGGAQPASGNLPLWMLVTISGGSPTAQGQMRGGFSTLIERGNIRALGPADKNLFNVPADFTKEQ